MRRAVLPRSPILRSWRLTAALSERRRWLQSLSMEKVQTLVKARLETDARALILFAAFASFVISAVLWFGGHRQEGILVGIWGAVDPVTRSDRASGRER
jgi:hypothetical protein